MNILRGFTNEHENKVQKLFDSKYKELAFEFKSGKDTWNQYVSKLNCSFSGFTKESSQNPLASEDVYILDPSPFGIFIVVPRKIAEKILVLGLP